MIHAVFIGVCALLLGAGLGALWAVRRFMKQWPARYNPGTVELVFTTADGGKTWQYYGKDLPASPLTDRLQDAVSAIVHDLLPGADATEIQAKRRERLDSRLKQRGTP